VTSFHISGRTSIVSIFHQRILGSERVSNSHESVNGQVNGAISLHETIYSLALLGPTLTTEGC
jgi:hypothetical protein